MKKTTTLMLAASMTLSLVGCSAGGSEEKHVVNVCSWGEYIDTDLITQFEEESGIKVNYQTVDSNEALDSLLRAGSANFDVIVPSDYLISQMIEEDRLQPINYENIPNFSLIDERFQNQPYDPENQFTVPYTWGTLGMIYNTTLIEDEITSWDAMFDTAYAGQVLMINNSRDAIGIALLALGYSVNTTSETELNEAKDLIAEAKTNGVYQSFVMDQVFSKMEGGEAALATYYAGDYLVMVDNNPDLAYVVPETGSNWFIDAMCILKDAENVSEAEEWINFICSTEASLANMDYIWYASPNTEALAGYPAYYEELYEEPLDMELYEIMAPSYDIEAAHEAYLVMPSNIRTLYSDLWTEIGVAG
ncbi:MAG: ABC transporter substrate-binding protein [Eubacteriales bacterium]